MNKRYTPKNSQERALRARWHDYNSQRRYRGQSTLSWREYQQKTQKGSARLTRKK